MSIIYGLLQDGEVRYVGKTDASLAARVKQHINETRRAKGGHRLNWLRSLEGGLPQAVILAREVHYDSVMAWERYVIMAFREMGACLVNSTDGGEGARGRCLSDDTRAKMRAARLGQMVAPETREKIRTALVGRSRPSQVVATIKAARWRDGRIASEKETAAWITLGDKRGWPKGSRHTAETKEKIRRSRLGVSRKHSMETRLRMASSQEARRRREKEAR